MASMPSPILIFGDKYLSKNNVIAAKKKYSSLKWVTMSAATDSLDSIRMEAGGALWGVSDKAVLIQELPNRKQTRDFLLDLASSLPETTKLVIWDSENCIKVNSKTQAFDKTWGAFVGEFRKIAGSKIINNGEKLTEKEEGDCVEFVKARFSKFGKEIGTREAKLLISIIGYNRGMLDSDIAKMSIIAPEKLTSNFIIENAFPSSKEAVLYKVANILDTASYENSINMINRFLEGGINANVISEIIVKKARWQMIVSYFLSKGVKPNDVTKKIIQMGKFPSYIWHNPNLDSSTKKAQSEGFQTDDGILKYLVEKYKYSIKDFKMIVPPKIKTKKTKKKVKEKRAKAIKKKSPESIPYPFMASQVVDFVVNKVCKQNNIKTQEDMKRVMCRSMRVYLFVHEKLANVRYGGNPTQDIQEMVRSITDIVV